MNDYILVPVEGHKNLFRRKGKLYFRGQINKRFFLRSIPETEIPAAERWIKRFRAGPGRAAAEPVKIDTTPCKMGDIFKAYLVGVARYGSPGMLTVFANVARFRKFLVPEGPASADALSSAGLTAERVLDWARSYLGSEPTDSRRRSARSTLRQIRSLFARRLVGSGAYSGLVLPNLAGFMSATPCQDPQHRYRMPLWEFIGAFLKEAHELEDTWPELYAAFLLMYYAAARPGDAVYAKWSWIDEHKTGSKTFYTIDFSEKVSEGYRPKASGGMVPLPAEVVRRLKAIHGPDAGEFILPEATISARRHLVGKRLCRFMRSVGWKTEKSAYELRKLRGCCWRFYYGLDRAHKWLRHTDYQTTLNYYADLLPGRAFPLFLEEGNELEESR